MMEELMKELYDKTKRKPEDIIKFFVNYTIWTCTLRQYTEREYILLTLSHPQSDSCYSRFQSDRFSKVLWRRRWPQPLTLWSRVSLRSEYRTPCLYYAPDWWPLYFPRPVWPWLIQDLWLSPWCGKPRGSSGQWRPDGWWLYRWSWSPLEACRYRILGGVLGHSGRRLERLEGGLDRMEKLAQWSGLLLFYTIKQLID